jgi:putative tricarboxylic transport membrane protein
MPRPKIELVFALLVGGLCVAGYHEASQYRGESAHLPQAALALGLILSLVWSVQCIMAIKRKETPETTLEEPVSWRKLILFVAAVLVYVIAIPRVGYFTSTLLFVPLVALFLGYRSKITLAAAPIAFVLVLHLLFARLLRIPLPDEIVLQLVGMS